MRTRVLRDLPPAGAWDVKLRVGGQIEVEFIAQVLQLVHAATVAPSPTTRIALARLCDAGALSAEDAALLIRADHLWRTVQGMMRITYGRQRSDKLSEAATAALLRAANASGIAAVDVAELHATFAALAEQVHAAFARHVHAAAEEDDA